MKSFLFSHPQRSSIYGTCRELLRRFSWRPIVQRIFQDSKGSFVLPWTGLNSVYHHIAKREERERMCLLHQCSSRTKKEPGHRVLSVIKFLTFKINIDFALSIWFHIVWKSPKMSHLNLSILAFPPIFVLLKLTCLVTLFDRKLHVFKNSPNWPFLAFLMNFCP